MVGAACKVLNGFCNKAVAFSGGGVHECEVQYVFLMFVLGAARGGPRSFKNVLNQLLLFNCCFVTVFCNCALQLCVCKCALQLGLQIQEVLTVVKV